MRFVVFKINNVDGYTEKVDLKDEEQAKEWLKKLDQEKVTGMAVVRKCNGKFKCPDCHKTCLTCNNCNNSSRNSVCNTKGLFSISKPRGFEKIFFLPEYVRPEIEKGNKGGQRITVFADDIRIVLMVHAGQPASRITFSKIGKQRYNPYAS
jgi:hypothetical protein